MYPRPTDKNDYELSIVSFSDASKVPKYGQLGMVTGILIGKLEANSIFHKISWIYHMYKRPVKSTPEAETFATSEAIDEAKIIYNTYKELLNIRLKVKYGRYLGFVHKSFNSEAINRSFY